MFTDEGNIGAKVLFLLLTTINEIIEKNTYEDFHNICQYNVADKYNEHHGLSLIYKYFDVDKVNFHMHLFLKEFH